MDIETRILGPQCPRITLQNPPALLSTMDTETRILGPLWSLFYSLLCTLGLGVNCVLHYTSWCCSSWISNGSSTFPGFLLLCTHYHTGPSPISRRPARTLPLPVYLEAAQLVFPNRCHLFGLWVGRFLHLSIISSPHFPTSSLDRSATTLRVQFPQRLVSPLAAVIGPPSLFCCLDRPLEGQCLADSAYCCSTLRWTPYTMTLFVTHIDYYLTLSSPNPPAIFL